MSKLSVAFLAALLLLARPVLAQSWLDDMRSAGPGEIGLNKTTGGALIGAIAGGLLGGQIGKGDTQLTATAAGVLAGALAGGYFGRQLDETDRSAMLQSTQRALSIGRQVAWRNPDNGNSLSVRPMHSFRTEDGTRCRDYERRVVIDGRVETGVATACRAPDGTWQIQD
jgi:surface antigen